MPEKVRVYVRSEVVPARVISVKTAVFSFSDKYVWKESRGVIYARILNREGQKAVERATELARLSGLPLEVVDISRRSIWRRVVDRLLGDTKEQMILIPVSSTSPPDQPAPIPDSLESRPVSCLCE